MDFISLGIDCTLSERVPFLSLDIVTQIPVQLYMKLPCRRLRGGAACSSGILHLRWTPHACPRWARRNRAFATMRRTMALHHCLQNTCDSYLPQTVIDRRIVRNKTQLQYRETNCGVERVDIYVSKTNHWQSRFLGILRLVLKP